MTPPLSRLGSRIRLPACRMATLPCHQVTTGSLHRSRCRRRARAFRQSFTARDGISRSSYFNTAAMVSYRLRPTLKIDSMVFLDLTVATGTIGDTSGTIDANSKGIGIRMTAPSYTGIYNNFVLQRCRVIGWGRWGLWSDNLEVSAGFHSASSVRTSPGTLPSSGRIPSHRTSSRTPIRSLIQPSIRPYRQGHLMPNVHSQAR